MELSELQHTWERLDTRIAENTKINKMVLAKLLLRKPRQRLLLMKAETVLQLLALVAVFILFFIRIKLREPGLLFYTGLALFSAITLLSFYSLIKDLAIMNKLHTSLPVLELNKRVLQLEKHKLFIRNIKLWGLFPSLVSVGLLVNLNWISGLAFKQDLLLPVLLFTIGNLAVAFYKTRLLRRQLKRINHELREISEL